MTDHDLVRDTLAMREGLSSEDEDRLATHLASCAPCRELEAEYARQDAFLRSLRLPQPPVTFEAGVLGAVHRHAVRYGRPWRHLAGVLTAAALVVLAVVAAVTVRERSSRSALAPAADRAPQYGPNRGVLDSGASGRGATQSSPRPVQGAPKEARPAPQVPSSGKGLGRSAVPRSAGALAGGPWSTSWSHGLKLSIALAPVAVPRGAVVSVQVRLWNMRDRPVQVVGAPQESGCGNRRPGVEVVDRRGRAISPLPLAPRSPCPVQPVGPGGAGYLLPGQSIATRTYAVLVTPRVRPAANVILCSGKRARGCTNRASVAVTGRPAVVRLKPRQGTTIALHGSPPTTFTVHPVRPNAQLWWSGWFSCDGTSAGGPTYTFGRFGPGDRAVRSSGTEPLGTALAGCNPRRLAIHLIAGWVGHTADAVNIAGRS